MLNKKYPKKLKKDLQIGNRDQIEYLLTPCLPLR